MARPAGRSPYGKRDALFRFSAPQVVYDRIKEMADQRGVPVNRFAETVLTEISVGGVHGEIIAVVPPVRQED